MNGYGEGGINVCDRLRMNYKVPPEAKGRILVCFPYALILAASKFYKTNPSVGSTCRPEIGLGKSKRNHKWESVDDDRLYL